MSIEEKLSKCILYNLKILKKFVRSSEQLDEILTEGIFLKSNTQTFIQVTYYLFNIIDAKEFRKQFYWPICDKKSENSYRTSSVEMINMLIDKHSLQQEKIKQVTVVHPSGKKFMSLMLDLILIAIKEVMRRKKYSSSKSMDINDVMAVATTINQVENDIMNSLRSELRKIKEKTQEAQEVLAKIYAGEIEFEKMIESWHSFNITRLNTIKENNEKVKEVYKSAKLLQQKAEDKLSDKKFSVSKPSASEMEKISEFYQQFNEHEHGNKFSILSLITYLKPTLPIILNYVNNFSYDQAEVSDEEMKIINLKLAEIEKLDAVISKMKERENFVKEKILKLKEEKEQQQLEEDMSITDENEEKIIKDAEEQEALRHLLSLCYDFDTSKNCVTSVALKRNRLAFAENDDEHIVDRSIILNQTKQFIDLKINNRSRNEEMGPPQKLPQPQKNRRRRDAMQLLEQAITTNKKLDMNSTKYGNHKVVYSTPLSSTLVSPDLIHHHRANLDFSMISSISTICETPVTSLKTPNINVPKVVNENVQSLNHDVMKARDEIENFCNENHKSKKNQKSVMVVSLEKAFGEDITNLQQQMPMSSSPLTLPKILITNEDETLKNISSFSNDMENTVRVNEIITNETQESEQTTIFRERKISEEDLFDVSDSLLVSD